MTGIKKENKTDHNIEHENGLCLGHDYKIANRAHVRKDGILSNSDSPYHNEPWTITSAHTNVTDATERKKQQG